MRSYGKTSLFVTCWKHGAALPPQADKPHHDYEGTRVWVAGHGGQSEWTGIHTGMGFTDETNVGVRFFYSMPIRHFLVVKFSFPRYSYTGPLSFDKLEITA